MTHMAEEEFQLIGLSPSHAFVVMTAINQPGIGPKQIGLGMQLAPSTVTRFVDALEKKGLLRREVSGREVSIFPTKKGEDLLPEINAAWKRLHDRYVDVLGKTKSDKLTKDIFAANQLLDPT